MIEEGKKYLFDSQNPDGGWGFTRGLRSNTEATALALMAIESLERSGGPKPPAVRALSWLKERQNPDGSWPLNDTSKIASWSTALAMLALVSSPGSREHLIRAGHWALGERGRGFGWLTKLLITLSFKRRSVELNEDLIGWPWMPDTFSWVEPTSYFLMALKKLRRDLNETQVTQRIRQGELMIYDRMCVDGGWNYGNSVVFGEKLWPYPDVTAIALIALQDHRERDANQKSLKALEAMLPGFDSGLALSWSIICLALHGRQVGKWQDLLARAYAKANFLGETKTIALALLALGDGVNFFKL